MTISPNYYLIVGLFLILALVYLLNALLVPSLKYMRLSIGVAGIGFFNLFMFYLGRGIGLIAGPPEIIAEVFRGSLIFMGIGLLSVGGVPLAMELRKRTKQKNQLHDLE
jgi:hypothetical protein